MSVTVPPACRRCSSSNLEGFRDDAFGTACCSADWPPSAANPLMIPFVLIMPTRGGALASLPRLTKPPPPPPPLEDVLALL
eukprot:9413016-Pyramimonas_sp.AAC.1